MSRPDTRVWWSDCHFSLACLQIPKLPNQTDPKFAWDSMKCKFFAQLLNANVLEKRAKKQFHAYHTPTYFTRISTHEVQVLCLVKSSNVTTKSNRSSGFNFPKEKTDLHTYIVK